ncbi:MAG: ATP-binding cassette domain-containing protein [Planctomycetes bacterium]|nr:ATP-binding cassette domain-containing protein [Planctomycetota bacterium]
MPLISVKDLRKDFKVLAHKSGLIGAMRNLFSAAGRIVNAVDGVSFSVEAGEFVGYVGPNGAGKSTTLKMLTGILVPSSGVIDVCGFSPPHKARTKLARRIGVVFGQRTQLWWDLPPRESYDLLMRLFGVPRGVFELRLARLSGLLELEGLLDTPVRKLSLGQKMRCELAAALLHEPALLLLDEPTIGMDVVVKEQVRKLLRRINEAGTTILLTSHDLDDIEQLCRRVMVIDKGRIIHDGGVDALKRRYGNRRRLVADFLDQPKLVLPQGAEVASIEGLRATIDFDADKLRAPEVIAAVVAGNRIHDIAIQECDIAEVVKRIYGEGK